jgi:hypothetical protein
MGRVLEVAYPAASRPDSDRIVQDLWRDAEELLGRDGVWEVTRRVAEEIHRRDGLSGARYDGAPGYAAMSHLTAVPSKPLSASAFDRLSSKVPLC